MVLTNEYLTVEIDAKGAELKKCIVKATGINLMWSGDPAFWGKTSPVLFPIVGSLKEDTYFFNQRSYKLPRHGFARDLNFEVEKISADQLTMKLISSQATLKQYPFEFELRITYTLDGKCLRVTYLVYNPAETDLYFSLGAHPAFAVPLLPDEKMEDYALVFGEEEALDRWPLTNTGLIQRASIPFGDTLQPMRLHKELFMQDALVFKNLRSGEISLQRHNDTTEWHFRWKDFPFFGIWSAKGAPFVCLEPWCGIADHEDHQQDLTLKEGIQKLASHQSWTRSWELESTSSL